MYIYKKNVSKYFEIVLMYKSKKVINKTQFTELFLKKKNLIPITGLGQWIHRKNKTREMKDSILQSDTFKAIARFLTIINKPGAHEQIIAKLISVGPTEIN